MEHEHKKQIIICKQLADPDGHNLELLANFLVRMIEKYGSELLEEIDEMEKKEQNKKA